MSSASLYEFFILESFVSTCNGIRCDPEVAGQLTHGWQTCSGFESAGTNNLSDLPPELFEGWDR
jgi:hypothetical protein